MIPDPWHMVAHFLSRSYKVTVVTDCASPFEPGDLPPSILGKTQQNLMDHLFPSSSSSVCALFTQTHPSKIVLRWRCVSVGTEFHLSTALVFFRVCLCFCDCLLMFLLQGKQRHSFLTSYILNKVHGNGKSGLLTIFKFLNFRSSSFIWVLVGVGVISLSVSLHLPLSLSLSSSSPLSLYLFCVCIRPGLASLTT